MTTEHSALAAAQVLDIMGEVIFADRAWVLRQSDALAFRALECDGDEVLRLSVAPHKIDGRLWASMVRSVMTMIEKDGR